MSEICFKFGSEDVRKITVEDSGVNILNMGRSGDRGVGISDISFDLASGKWTVLLSDGTRTQTPSITDYLLANPPYATRAFADIAALKSSPDLVLGRNYDVTVGPTGQMQSYSYLSSGATPYAEDGINVLKVDGVDLAVGALVRTPSNVVENSHAAMHDIWHAGGIVRIPTATPTVPGFIDNLEHRPFNMASVEILQEPDPNEGSLALYFERPGYANGVHHVTVDETYAANDFTVGVRGTKEGPIIKGFAPLIFALNMKSRSVGEHTYFNNTVSAAIGVGGAVVITHPSTGNSKIPSIVENLGTGYDTRVIASTSTTLTVQNFVPLGGQFRESGGNLVFTGPTQFKPTATFDISKGEIVIILGQTGYTIANGCQIPLDLTNYRPGTFFKAPAFSGNRLSIKIPVKDATGAAITSITGMDFDFSIPSWKVPSDVRAGVIRVRKGRAEVNWTNAANDLANVWCSSLIPMSYF